jgi:Sulfotransferase family
MGVVRRDVIVHVGNLLLSDAVTEIRSRDILSRPIDMAGRLRKPDLFVVGAMKSGTTYLNKLLGSHPAIFMCSPEEPSYFVEPAQLRKLWPEAWDLGYWRSEEHYLRLFRAAKDATVTGEASTSYSKLPLVTGVPERIRSFNPNAHILYLMRDPVERTISHYWHMVRYHAEHRPMLEAIRADPQYIDVSHYAMQLRPYLDQFGAGRIMTLTFEHLTRAPVEAMRIVYDWLGVSSTGVDISGVTDAENVTPEVVRVAAFHGVLQKLRQSGPLRRLTPHLPRLIREKAIRLTTTEVRRRAVDTSEVIRFLQPIQRRQTETLVRLVGREFPEWVTLYDTVV